MDKISISKKNVDNIIKDYVDTKYSKLSKKYIEKLDELKDSKLNNINDISYINNNLMWQDNDNIEERTFSYIEAKLYCRKLKLASRKDWRVPTQNELMQLINFFNYEPAVLTGFNYFKSGIFWSSSKDLDSNSKYWIVDFKYGETRTINKNKVANLKCVRTISAKKGTY